MTILNFAIDSDRIFVAVDAALSSPGLGRTGATSKVIALPHLNSIVAGHGSAAAIARFGVYAVHLTDAASIGELIGESGDVLRRIWSNCEFDPVRAHAIGLGVLVAGIDQDGRAQAAYFGAGDDFAPRRYERAAFLSPMPKRLRAAAETAATAAELPATDDASTGQNCAQPTPRVPWHRLVQSCVELVREQQADAEPGSIGGQVWGTLVTHGAIHCHEHVNLDEPPPEL